MEHPTPTAPELLLEDRADIAAQLAKVARIADERLSQMYYPTDMPPQEVIQYQDFPGSLNGFHDD